jgi:hypothetical protein
MKAPVLVDVSGQLITDDDDAPASEMLLFVTPSAAERGIVDAALHHARACGLALPENALVIRFVARLEILGRRLRGMTIDWVRPIEIRLERGHPFDDLYATVLHEASHVHDALVRPGLSRAEGEARAVAFTAFALRPLHALGRGELPTFPLQRWAR